MSHLPDHMDRRLLRGFERVAVPLVERLNEMPRTRDLVHTVVGSVNAMWIHKLTEPLWIVTGFAPLKQLNPAHGLILVSNHRSFFDMFLLSTPINRYTKLHRRPAYPVRANFFYENPMGLFLNLAISGGSMWPPVFRDGERRALNPIGFKQLASVLQSGGFAGLHPEGKRNRGPDPYTFLPLKPGLGHLLRECAPDTVVVPCFVAGVENDASSLIRRALKPKGQRGEPIRLRYGTPMTVRELKAMELEPMAVTEHVFDGVRALAAQDRAEAESGAWASGDWETGL